MIRMEMIRAEKKTMRDRLIKYQQMSGEELAQQRYQRFRGM